MRASLLPLAALLAAVGAAPLAAQGAPARGPTAPSSAARLDAVDHAARQERLALTGDLGLPPLPPVTADSPRDDLRFADRFPVLPDTSAYAGVPAPVLLDGLIPKGPDGTGTDKNEVFQYMLPWDYDPDGPPIPLLIAYHGFGASAKSVANQSTLDEEANLRGWAYVAPTGIDDQLFGSPVSQQNTEAAVRWMLDEFAIDPDRVHMVGFSMGGGIAANFAARRRDPDGLMIAGLGLVAPACDWTMTFLEGTSALKDLLKNPYNFGAHPNQVPFAYQRSSALVFDRETYPPLPGVLQPELSMATNLGTTPVLLTWDTGDPLPLPAAQDPVLADLLASLGGTVDVRVVSGTVAGDPPEPAPHSWAVLDVPGLFDFLEPLRARRRPAAWQALVDEDRSVAEVAVTQAQPGAFSRLASRPTPGLSVVDLENVAGLVLDGRAVADLPAPVEVVVADGGALDLSLAGLPGPPTHLLDGGGRLVHDVRGEPVAQRLELTLAAADDGGSGRLTASVQSAPLWTASLRSAPDPLPVGQFVTVSAQAPGAAGLAWLVVGPADGLAPLDGGLLSVVPLGPGALVAPLPLAADGSAEVEIHVPVLPELQGTHLHLQLIVPDAQGVPAALSNHWMAWFQ